MAYFNYIQSRIEKVLLHTAESNAPVRNYISYQFLTEKTELSEDYIYLSDIVTALKVIDHSQPTDALLIVGGQTTPGERNQLKKACSEKLPYICSSSPILNIGNTLNRMFYDESKISRGFVEISKSKNELAEVTNSFSSICQCTALLMNMSGYILQSAGENLFENSWLSETVSNGYLDAAVLRNLCSITDEKLSPPCINITYQGLELYFSRVSANGSPHLCMLLISEKKIQDLDPMYLLMRFQEFIVSYIMSRHKEGFYESRSAFNAFMTDIKNDRLKGGLKIYNRLFSLEYGPPKDSEFLIRLGVIRFSAKKTDDERLPYNLLLTQLRNIFPNTNITAFPNEIIMLFFIPRTGSHIRVLKKTEHNRELEDLLERYDGYLTLSRASDGFSHIKTHYNLLLRLQEIAPSIEKGRVLTFHENMDVLITSFFVSYFCANNTPNALADYLHPDVANLWVIDSRENNNLSEVLYNYLLNDRSLQKTAAATFMHRNTVAYKINQITTLTDIDFDDPEECQIILASCKLLRYMTKVMLVFPSNGPMRRELQH